MEAVCKCCGGKAPIYGLVDFHKNCEQRRVPVLKLSGIPIYYHRCLSCKFVFTAAFDAFTNQDFAERIYNADYRLVDPDYDRVRPVELAKILNRLFPNPRPNRVLDYGAGTGLLGDLLSAAGFPQVVAFDPFVDRHSTRPIGKFDLIICAEVMEHSTDPRRLIADLDEFLDTPGLVFLTTVVQPENLEEIGLNWWYAAPRNGHVSLYSKLSLAILGKSLGFHVGSFDEANHIIFRRMPEFAHHILKAG
jgi:2-polyprenyl-6-hydroxyphenyl methylase/3-demethylubiquinone-9 3-methyltransferase